MIKELVEYIAKSLVDNPDDVKVTENDSENLNVIGIEVSQEDTGKVIGKEGRIANAIRTVVKAAGSGSRKRVTVEIMTQDKRR